MRGAGNGVGIPARERADELERDVEMLRGDLRELVDELDQRRHEAFDVRRQLRRHPAAIVVTAVALAGLVAVGITLALRRRRRPSLSIRLRELRDAVGHSTAHRPRALSEAGMAGMGRKIATAGGTAMASVLARRLATRLVSG